MVLIFIWRIFLIRAMTRDHRTFLSFGFFICLWSAATAGDISAVACTCKKEDICEEKCNYAKEPHRLDCFGRTLQTGIVQYQCVWNLGRYREYDLYIKQRKCKKETRVSNQSMTSHLFSLANRPVTAYAIALDDQNRCVYAKFNGTASKIIRCGPPNKVSFNRRSGQLSVTAEWGSSNVKTYYLKYRKHNTDEWNKVQSQDSRNSIVGSLSSSLSYDIQIWCNETAVCPQCQPSKIIRVQQEFIDAPVIKAVDYHLIQTGKRRVVVKWEFLHSEEVEHYNITVQKASGESAVESSYILHAPTVTLILCHSAYNISINAFNNAGPSPDAHTFIEVMEDGNSDWNDTLNVSVINNTSFSLSWSKTLAQKYLCYSVEWWIRGEQPTYEIFYSKKNHIDVQTENVSFKPYKKYHFLLNARPEKDACNLKNVNNSDQTFGRTQAYLTEGTPLAAPGNVTVSNVTQSSFVINWSTVPEEDLQGFLQGYIIRYTDRLDGSEKNITVGPGVNSYELVNLKSRSMYYVQLSAYTVAGEGRRSDVMSFETHNSVPLSGMLAGVLLGTIGLLLVIQLCCRLLQRSKNLLWPNIPNPYNSNAVQKIEATQELEMMADFERTEEHVCVLEIKTCTACSFSQIYQDCMNEELVPVMVSDSTAALSDCINLPQFPTTSTLTDSTSTQALPIDDDPNSFTLVSPTESETTGDNTMTESANVQTECIFTAVPNSSAPPVSDYTTMELFQQITNAQVQGPSNQESNSKPAPSNAGQDYIRQVLSYTQNQQHERSYQ